jgi:hypothetical protein
VNVQADDDNAPRSVLPLQCLAGASACLTDNSLLLTRSIKSTMSAGATRDTAPAVVFLVLYTAVLAVLAYLYATKAVRWRSRYSFVLFHVVMRVVGMALGVAFSCLEWEDETGGGPRFGGACARVWGIGVWLTLTLSSVQSSSRISSFPPRATSPSFSASAVRAFPFRSSRHALTQQFSHPAGFLIVWQQDRLGRSNLEPRIPKGTPRRERFRLLLAAPMTGFEYNLIAANAIIIAGSSIMSGAIKHPDEPKAHRQETIGKAMRAFSFAQTSLRLRLALQTDLWHPSRHRRDRQLYRPRSGCRPCRVLVVPQTRRPHLG